MNNYYVKVVETKEDIKLFHLLPYKIYKNDPNWIPHVKQEVEQVFNCRKNKYFNHGFCIRWIARNQNNEITGRIAAFVNEKKAYTFKQPTGGIGFFECINDYALACSLFDTAKTWLISKNMAAMDGPVNFGENNKFWGLMIDNFDFPPYYGQNYNPPWYKTFFQSYGFKIYFNQLVYHRLVDKELPLKYQQKSAAILKDASYSIKSMDKKHLLKYAEDFRTIYNAAWVTHDNFKEMSGEMAISIFRHAKPIIDNKLVCFVYFENNPVAFCLCIPDINPIIRRLKGNLSFFGKLKFLFYKIFVPLTRMNGVAFGVHPNFQHKGIEGAIFADLAKRLQGRSSYREVVTTWVGDFNPKMQHIFEEMGFTIKSKLATYRKLFDETVAFERSKIIC
jgi:hypothetical protein